VLVLSQHADEHRPERPILLAVDQETRRRRGSLGRPGVKEGGKPLSAPRTP
jgi:hypothetical protein